MQLEDEIRRQLHILVTFVNELQNIAIAGNLTFGAVPGLRVSVLLDQSLDRRTRQRDTFEAVRDLLCE